MSRYLLFKLAAGVVHDRNLSIGPDVTSDAYCAGDSDSRDAYRFCMYRMANVIDTTWYSVIVSHPSLKSIHSLPPSFPYLISLA